MKEWVNEQLIKIKNNVESQINKYNADTESKFSCVIDKIEENINKNMDVYKINTNIKINEIENTCKANIQSLQDTVDEINKRSIQSECINNNKLIKNKFNDQ